MYLALETSIMNQSISLILLWEVDTCVLCMNLACTDTLSIVKHLLATFSLVFIAGYYHCIPSSMELGIKRSNLRDKRNQIQSTFEKHEILQEYY